MKAIWNDTVIAESNETISIEGNEYFPPDSVKKDFLIKSSHKTMCPWKGEASYYDLVVNETTNKNAAWHYPQPLPKASHIKNYVAFWRGVEVAK